MPDLQEKRLESETGINHRVKGHDGLAYNVPSRE